jgi:uncharacterized lipoprotein YmbA
MDRMRTFLALMLLLLIAGCAGGDPSATTPAARQEKYGP